MKNVTLVAVLVFASSANAGVVLTIEEIGSDVVVSGGGTLDMSLWTGPMLGGSGGRIFAEGNVTVGPDAPIDIYTDPIDFGGPSTIGPGMNVFLQDSATGDTFGLTWIPVNPSLTVPRKYVAGDQLSGSATFAGETFSSIGLIPGSYTWTWDAASGSDFFTINVVPAPGALALLGIGGLLIHRRRRC